MRLKEHQLTFDSQVTEALLTLSDKDQELYPDNAYSGEELFSLGKCTALLKKGSRNRKLIERLQELYECSGSAEYLPCYKIHH